MRGRHFVLVRHRLAWQTRASFGSIFDVFAEKPAKPLCFALSLSNLEIVFASLTIIRHFMLLMKKSHVNIVLSRSHTLTNIRETNIRERVKERKRKTDRYNFINGADDDFRFHLASNFLLNSILIKNIFSINFYIIFCTFNWKIQFNLLKKISLLFLHYFGHKNK